MKYTLTLFLLAIHLISLNAQQSDLENYEDMLTELSNEKRYTDIIDTLSNTEYQSSFITLILAEANYFQGQDKIALDLLDTLHTADFMSNVKSRFAFNKASFLDRNAKHDIALLYRDTALLYFPQSDQGHTLCDIYSTTGNSYFYLGDFISAIAKMKQAISCFEDAGQIDRSISAQINIGALYIETRNFNEAISIFKKVLKNYKVNHVSEDEGYYSYLYNNLGIAYQNINNDSAWHYLVEGKPYYHPKEFWGFHNSMSSNFLKMEMLDSAMYHIKKSKEYAIRFDDNDQLNYSLSNECSYYYEKGELARSVKCYEGVRDYFMATSSMLSQKDFLKYYTLAKYKAAYKNEELERFFELSDSTENDIVKMEIDKAVGELKTKITRDSLQYLTQEATILTQSNNTKQNLLLAILSLLGLLLAGGYYFFSKITKKRNEIKLLNQELNHRVKNNLAFMTSLLQMQGRRQTNLEAQKAIKESESRLKALSLVHEKLFYREKDTTIDIKDYLQSVLSYLEQLFGEAQRSVTLNLISDQLDVAAEDAMRIGLIINELVTNSVKHHNTDNENIEINIKINKDPSQKLTIDYNDGSYKYDYHQEPDAAQSTSMGKMLIYLLLDQLSPKVRIV